MAGASRDLTVNLIGKTDGLRRAFSGLFGGGAGGGLGGLTGGLGKAGIFGAVAASAIAAGGAVFKLGENFDDAYDTIRTQTGATGDALTSLTDSFDDVLASGPSSFDDVATAIGDLNSRLGLTGQPLEDVATNMLDLSRITGTDLSGNIESVTRLFGDWGVAGDDMVGTMDELLRASQGSGVEVDKLSDLMVRFGAPLRQLGFGFEESLALFGKFEAQGVNTELVMGSMRIALGRLAKEGESAPEALRRITDEIKNMEDPTDATALAIELFGQRAGPDMAAAIREGRFEVDDLMASITDGQETIQSARADTDDWRESWETLKNRTFVALKPLALGFFDAIGNAMQVIEERGLGGAIVRGLQNLGEAVKDGAGELVSLGAQFGNWILDGLEDFWDSTLKPWLQDLPGNAVEAIGDAAEFLFDKGWDLIRGLWDGAREFWFTTAWPFIKSLPGKALDAIGEVAATLFLKGWDLIRGLWQGARDFWFTTAWPFIKSLPGKAVEAIGDLAMKLYLKGWNLIGGLKNGIVDFWTTVAWPWLRGLPLRIVHAVGDLAGLLSNAGRAIIQSLIDGILSAEKTLWSVLLRIGRSVANYWNSLVGSFGGLFSGVQQITPAPKPPSVGDKFHSGGIVPGPLGKEVLAILQAGEEVIPIGGRQPVGTGGDIFYVTVHTEASGESVLRALRQVQRRRGPLPLAVR